MTVAQRASDEDRQFCAELTKRLKGQGAIVTAFEGVDGRYAMVIALGPRRRVVRASMPFHYETLDEMERLALEWIADMKAADGARWTTNPEVAG